MLDTSISVLLWSRQAPMAVSNTSLFKQTLQPRSWGRRGDKGGLTPAQHFYGSSAPLEKLKTYAFLLLQLKNCPKIS